MFKKEIKNYHITKTLMRDIINIHKPFIVKNKKYNFDLDANIGDKIKMLKGGAMYFRCDIKNKTLSPLWQFDKLFLDEIIKQAKIVGNEITQEDENIGIWGVFETGESVNATSPLMCYIEATSNEDAHEKCIPIIKRWDEWLHKLKELSLHNKELKFFNLDKENITYSTWRWDEN